MAKARESSKAKRGETPESGAKPEAPRSSPSSPETYTDPALRDRLKAEIRAGEKGGKADEWSARKSQLLAAAYNKAGGGYKKAKKTEAQKDLDSWTDEKWTTADGKPAIKEDGETARYLPEKAWDELTPAQKEATNAKKKAGSRAGEQFVPNTEAAKKARKASKKS